MSTFKIAVTAIFAVCIIAGIALFATSKGISTSGNSNLLVWGTVQKEAFDAALKASSVMGNKTIKVTYVKKDASTFDTDFVEALADGTGPDIVLLREDSMYKNRNRLLTIPYANFSERSFKDAFIEESEIFLTPDGLVGLPFIVDPMVMYWNRDMFSNNLVSQTPKYWDEVYGLIDKMTRRDASANILQSAIAFGEWRNITNAKEVVSMLLMQAGTPITMRGNEGQVISVLNSQFGYPVTPSQSAINFYTQFSNPTSPTYTWNRSLPTSANFFLSGNLGMYIGFASEIFSIQQKNSNLNFDVTYVPQIRNASRKAVFAHMYVLAIVKQSQQVSGAFAAITSLTEPASLKAMEAITNLPPVRRDLLAGKPADPFRAVFYDSALISHAWIDPDATASSNTFRDMIESITSGRGRIIEALASANDDLSAQLK